MKYHCKITLNVQEEYRGAPELRLKMVPVHYQSQNQNNHFIRENSMTGMIGT